MRDKVIIQSILGYIEDIENDVSECHDIEDYLDDYNLQRLCSFSLIQIGELIKRLSSKITDRYKNVEWSEIAKLRDYLVHNYVKIEAMEIWSDVTEDIPQLKKSLVKILTELNDDEEGE